MSATVELRLSGAVDHLRLVWQASETVLETVPFHDDPEGTRYNVLVALQEMLTNIYRHAYGGDVDQTVSVELRAGDEGFAVTLRDRGPAFDPRTVPPPAIPEDGMPNDCGGFGIMITRAVMDAIDYQRVGGENVLKMTKAATPRRSPVPASVG
jgi:anti-sigma regulatory factor (Ser/Thr protein kinase)